MPPTLPNRPSVSPNCGAPPPRPRLGPRPLALHLSQAAQLCLASPEGWKRWSAVSPRLKAAAIEAAAASQLRSQKAAPGAAALLDPETGPAPELAQGLNAAALATFARFLDAVARYRRHPYRRSLAEPPCLWQQGSARLLDYGGAGQTVLIVPSLVNRAYILDLSPRASLARALASAGQRVLLLDWGWPGAEERAFDLGAYVRHRLEPALAEAARIGGGRVSVVGYCMGGTLAVALAARNGARIAKLALLAAPWDFHAGDPTRAAAAAAVFRLWQPLVEAMGILPLDAIETLFAMLDPGLVVRKFLRFSRLDPHGPAAQDFVALEDWVGDGVPLAAPAAAEALLGWYGENRPALGNWAVGGMPVDPRDVTAPSLLVVPARDRIVPPDSARALARRLPHPHILSVATGHIGLAVGASAAETVWKPLISFLNA
jgi:polyhydroxyalkanoate synthase